MGPSSTGSSEFGDTTRTPGPARKKILILEDQDAIRNLMRVLLEDEGYAVFDSDNGFEAFEYILKHNNVDLALVNLKMPAMPGVSFIRRLQELPEKMRPKVIVVTGNITSPEDDGYADLDVVAILRKPFDNQELISHVNATLQVGRLQ